MAWLSGGTVTPLAAIAVGTSWFVRRETGIGQPSSFPSGNYNASQHEAAHDRLSLIEQEQARELDRTPKVPRSESRYELPSASDRANKFLAFDNDGNPISSAGTGTDSGLRTGLASSLLGTLLIAWKRAGVGAAARALWARLADLPHSVKDFGAIGDGITDDTAAVQAAVNVAILTGKQLFVPAPSVAYRLTAQIVVANGLSAYGEGTTVTSGGSGSLSTPSVGSWFFLDHTGIGFYCNDDASPTTAKWFIKFTNIGCYRTHPAPGGEVESDRLW